MTTKEQKIQFTVDPRKTLFLAYYLDPKSPTFANAYQSGMKAGFSEEYSANITAKMPDWLAEKVGSLSPMLLKAERNINEMLDLPSKTQAMGAFGPLFEKVKTKVKGKNGREKTMVEKRPILTFNQGLLQKKLDASLFVAETVGKKKYSKKGANGPVFNTIIFQNGQRTKIARRILGGGSSDSRASEELSD